MHKDERKALDRYCRQYGISDADRDRALAHAERNNNALYWRAGGEYWVVGTGYPDGGYDRMDLRDWVRGHAAF